MSIFVVFTNFDKATIAPNTFDYTIANKYFIKNVQSMKLQRPNTMT